MAVPKSGTRNTCAGAYLEAAVDIGSISANTTLDVEVAAPRSFKYNRPVLIVLESTATALDAGVLLDSVGWVVNNSGKKIRFRVINTTASPVNPASKTFLFFQI